MTRTNASARKAGQTHERSIADYLRLKLDDRVDIRPKNGRKDRGDIGGVLLPSGGRVVLELKNYNGSVKVKPWLDEAEVERGNDDAAVGLVIAKRSGTAKPGDQLVMMTVDTLLCYRVGGQRVNHENGCLAYDSQESAEKALAVERRRMEKLLEDLEEANEHIDSWMLQRLIVAARTEVRIYLAEEAVTS